MQGTIEAITSVLKAAGSSGGLTTIGGVLEGAAAAAFTPRTGIGSIRRTALGAGAGLVAGGAQAGAEALGYPGVGNLVGNVALGAQIGFAGGALLPIPGVGPGVGAAVGAGLGAAYTGYKAAKPTPMRYPTQ